MFNDEKSLAKALEEYISENYFEYFSPEESYAALSFLTIHKIKAILEDDSLDDVECFERIEKIVCLFEALNIPSGNRHDFG